MAVRITQLPVDVIRTYVSTDASVRVTQCLLEVVRYDESLDLSGVIASDDLDSWSDSLGLFVDGLNPNDDLDNWNEALAIEYGIALSPSLDNWADDVQLTEYIFAVPLTVDVEDMISQKTYKPPSGGIIYARKYLKDGLEILKNPDSLDIGVDDLSDNLDDSLGLEIGLAFSDDLNSWNDSVVNAFAILHNHYDTMFYSWADYHNLGLSAGANVTDDLDSWVDNLDILNRLTINKGDTFSMSDSLLPKFQGYLSTLSDDLDSWDDDVQLSVLLSATVGDDLDTWLDAAIMAFVLPTGPVTEGDDLDNWSDEVGTLLSTSDINYLRRYLDDVIR